MSSSEKIPLKSEEYKPMTEFELYKKSYKDLMQAPYDLWILFLIKFCLFGSISLFFVTLSIYIIEVHELSDLYLSAIFLIFGVVSLILAPIAGSFTDKYGLKTSVLVGSLFIGATFTLIAIIENIYLQILFIIFPGFLGFSMAVPPLEIGLKSYTHLHYRSLAIAFNAAIVYFSLMIVGVTVEILMVYVGTNETSFRILYIICAALCLISFVLAFFLRQLDLAYNDEEEISLENTSEKSTWKHIHELIILKKFWRFIGVLMFVLTIKTVFYQQTVILPIYMDRDLGSDSHYGLMIILNQVFIIMLLPIFSYTIYFLNSYDVFLIGGIFATLSPLPFVFGASYATVVGFIFISSVGESLYAPKLLEYALEVSPKGKEGILISLAAVPAILSIIFAGAIGGVLLNSYCPDDGDRECWAMWVYIMGISLIALMIMFFCRRWLEEPLFETQPFVSCSDESKKT